MGECDLFDRMEETIPHLRRYAQALTRNPDQADDLVQDTLERAISRRASFTPGTNLRSWMFTLMHNLFIDQCRRARRRGVALPLEDCNEGGCAPAQLWAARAAETVEALRRLRPSEQEVLMLVSIKGLKYEEAAARLGVKLGTVKSRLFRARGALRAMGCGL